MPLLYVHECKACFKRSSPDLVNDLPPGWHNIAVWKSKDPPNWSMIVMICDTCSKQLLGAILEGD